MSVSDLSEQLAALAKQAGQEDAASCEMELAGSELLVTGNRAALLRIAVAAKSLLLLELLALTSRLTAQTLLPTRRSA